jgi:hypothetical protein
VGSMGRQLQGQIQRGRPCATDLQSRFLARFEFFVTGRPCRRAGTLESRRRGDRVADPHRPAVDRPPARVQRPRRRVVTLYNPSGFPDLFVEGEGARELQDRVQEMLALPPFPAMSGPNRYADCRGRGVMGARRRRNTTLYNPTLAMYHYAKCPLRISRYRSRERVSDVAIGKHFHSQRLRSSAADVLRVRAWIADHRCHGLRTK